MLGGIVGPEPRVGQTRIADSARVGRLAKELGGSRRSWEPRMSWEARAGVGRLHRSWEARAGVGRLAHTLLKILNFFPR